MTVQCLADQRSSFCAFNLDGIVPVDLSEQAGATVIPPGCGPEVSDKEGQVTISAINHILNGWSGTGRMCLAWPYTVAAYAIEGKIVVWKPETFAR